MERRRQQAATRDGRTLAFAEWGDPDGFPVFSLHGTPTSRTTSHDTLPITSMQPVALLRHCTFAYVPPMQTSALSLSRHVPLLASQRPPSFGLLQETTNSATTANDTRREVMGSPGSM